LAGAAVVDLAVPMLRLVAGLGAAVAGVLDIHFLLFALLT
jgi:hypothetical protein